MQTPAEAAQLRLNGNSDPSRPSAELDASNITTGDLYRTAWAASLGSALEYYDFALYNLAAALIFGPLFFPSSDPTVGLIASYGTFFVGFAVRPVGGVLFGSLGDRFGRKFALMATILLMGAASTLIGVLPTYKTAGYWAPVMLVGLRLLQGLGAGAEQAGASVLMTECAPRARRGYFAALPYMGIELGTVLATLIYFLVFRRIGNVNDSWLWRIPFLLSVVIIGVALWMRIKLKESPAFKKLEACHQVEKRPFADLMTNSKKSVLLVIGLRMGEMGGSAIHQTLAISYMVTVMGLTSQAGTFALMLAAFIGAIVIPITGLLSDRFGRVIVFRWFAIYQLLIAFPTWWVLSRGDQTTSIIMLSVALIAVWGMFSTEGAFLPELFGARHRYIGVATGREVSAVLAGGTAPLIGAFIIRRTGIHHGGGKQAAMLAWIPLAAFVAILSLIAVITTFYMTEPRGRDLSDLHDAGKEAVM
jgi:MFS transporter, MHS family, metabolite:H+ symporter